jgi:predicted transcriptional regulator
MKRKLGPTEGFPVRVRGVVYPSQRAAATALGVAEKTVRNALDAGTIDLVGLRGPGTPGKPCTYRGAEYPSMTAAAVACGVSEKTVRNHMRAA